MEYFPLTTQIPEKNFYMIRQVKRQMADLEKYFNLYHLMHKGLLEIERKNFNKSLEKNKSNANGPEV